MVTLERNGLVIAESPWANPHTALARMSSHLGYSARHRVNLPVDLRCLEPTKVVESELEYFLEGPGSPAEHLAISSSNFRSISNSYAESSFDLAL